MHYRGNPHLRNSQFLKGKGSDLPPVSHFKETRNVARPHDDIRGGEFLNFKKLAKRVKVASYLSGVS